MTSHCWSYASSPSLGVKYERWDNAFGLMHEWVDQFATQPKSLFTQNCGQILKITTLVYISLH